jgi:hypothetical protein
MGSNIWTGTVTFSATNGQETIVPVPAPHMGELRGVVLTQTSGTTSGFTAKLYTTSAATPVLPLSHYLIKDLSAAGAESAAYDLNIAYMNRDGDPTNRPGYVYLRITPSAAGNFALTLTVGTPAYL